MIYNNLSIILTTISSTLMNITPSFKCSSIAELHIYIFKIIQTQVSQRKRMYTHNQSTKLLGMFKTEPTQ